MIFQFNYSKKGVHYSIMEKEDKKILIVGLGLLGMSLAMAFRKTGIQVMGFNRHREAVEYGIREGILLPESEEMLETLLAKADVVFLALPIPATVEFLEKYAGCFKKGAVVTDLNSTKSAFMNKAEEVLPPQNVFYVGSHPMAGTEKSGYENAFETLYDNADVFICAADFEAPEVRIIEELWQSISCKTVRITKEKHDNLVARTSHVAHILASALTISVLGYEDKFDNFAGCAGGFRDTSRTASSNPVMWKEIIENNRDAVLKAMDYFECEYSKFRKIIEENRFDDFEHEFAIGRNLREEWLQYMENKKGNKKK